ncbi:MAG: sulfate permease [Hyphomonas sp.]|uniref:SulP family inorganic anion transporter n=1 Tax=Hyphomonas sp. TaxID=87 RepID=UPI0035273B86
MKLSNYLPILDWGRTYRGETLANDLIAAVIVTIMLIPQSLAYALLAGLPPQVGLYASILPLVAYAIFGTSRTLAVGPVAVLSLMTAAAAGNIAAQGSEEYIAAAMLLAFLSGIFLMALGLLRLGFLANFLSHPVVSGFITASGILIAASQVKHLLGIPAGGHNLYEMVVQIAEKIGELNMPTMAIGVSSLVFLFWVRSGLKPLLMQLGMKEKAAGMVSRGGPVIAVVTGILAVSFLHLDTQGVRIVGKIPSGLPTLGVPAFDLHLWEQLIGSAILISIIGFVESVSVAQTLAAKRRQRIDPDQELVALGAASLASGVSGGYPVTGGFARSAVNFDAGAETPAAGAFTAVGIALAALYLTPLLHNLPQAVLAATIVVAVLSLVDFKILRRTWAYSKRDFAAMAGTILVTLLAGVELGVTTGVVLSLFLHLYITSKPHFAIVGQVPGTHHFRNVNRYGVVVPEHIVTIRIDESLYFANARFLEDMVYTILGNRPDMKHLILMCPAVNHIDASGLESLEAINARLKDAGVKLHLSEVKGPVTDRLKRTHFLQDLTGNLYLDQFDAISDLDVDCAKAAVEKSGKLTEPGSVPCPSVTIAGVRETGR